MNKQVIIACDFSTKEDFVNFISKFEEQLFLKIGMELFYNAGKEVVEYAKKRGHKVFLDLKLHDIPNTVYKAMKNLVELEVDFVTVHASGGFEMMSVVAKALEHSETKALAVTVLTSLDNNSLKEELNINSDVNEHVLKLATLAKRSGINHIVCSPNEVQTIKNKLDVVCITPGIRLIGDSKSDQKRVTTPKDAYALGSDYIVVGRSITNSADAVQAYKRCVKEFGGNDE